VKALRLVAVVQAQKAGQLGGFHALGNDLELRLRAMLMMARTMAASSGSLAMSRTKDWSILSLSTAKRLSRPGWSIPCQSRRSTGTRPAP
jgi:hypothetical protein